MFSDSVSSSFLIDSNVSNIKRDETQYHTAGYNHFMKSTDPSVTSVSLSAAERMTKKVIVITM